MAPTRPAVVVLNGGSSAGKSSIARCLQNLLGPTWMSLGVDDLIRALPGGDLPVGHQPAIDFGADGGVETGPDYRLAEDSWYQGLAAIARCGTGLIIDEVFLGGASSQRRLAEQLGGLDVLWVGVHCDPDVAEARERTREDRIAGMARGQARIAHEGVYYDLVVDTTHTRAPACAALIAQRLTDGE